MGHMPMHGAEGSLESLSCSASAGGSIIHLNNTNPAARSPARAERAAVEGRGWEIGYDGMEIDCDELLSPERARGAPARDRRGALPQPAPVPSAAARRRAERGQVQAWALNRYYYQVDDTDQGRACSGADARPELRRDWRQRIVDHDGEARRRGRHRALAGADRRARTRPRLCRLDAGRPPGHPLRRARPMSISCRDAALLEAVASSLTEMFSPQIISERVAGMLAHYDFVTAERSPISTKRLTQAPRDADFALDYVQARGAHAGAAAGGAAGADASSATCCGPARCAVLSPMSSRR